MKTDCTREQLGFGRLGRREVVADFGGGQLSSDGGALLLGLVEEKIGLVGGFVRHAMRDYRDPGRIEHSLPELVKQRVFGLSLGYEDVCDHDQLRRDPLLACAVGKRDPSGKARPGRDQGRPLASSATLHRLETTAESPAHERYHRFDLDPEAADDFFLAHFVASMKRKQKQAPDELVIDFDPSEVPLHGQQEGRFFHGYYGNYCYLPLFVYCGDSLLCVRLQTADGDAARNTIEVMERIVAKFRAAWPQVRIVLRADSGFSREAIYAWCEANGVDYVIGLARNQRLEKIIRPQLDQARATFEETGQAARVFRDFDYQTLDSWSKARRVIAKAEHLPKGQNPRFVVTSLTERDPRWLYEDLYCQRGEAENRIKEQQLYLFGTRLSAGSMRTNQNRLYFSALAYLLICELRETGLAARHRHGSRARRHDSPAALQDRRPGPRLRPKSLDPLVLGVPLRGRLSPGAGSTHSQPQARYVTPALQPETRAPSRGAGGFHFSTTLFRPKFASILARRRSRHSPPRITNSFNTVCSHSGVAQELVSEAG